MPRPEARRRPPRPGPLLGSLALAAVSLAALAAGPIGCARTYGPWTETSERPVAPLAHPELATAAARLQPGPEHGFRFAALGDQRALADGEWQRLLAGLAGLAARDDRLLFLLDTGDIVNDGSHADQFHALQRILAPVADLPYLVTVGNHELRNNRPGPAREHLTAFLAPLDPMVRAGRLYYRKDVGPLRLLVLDTNDWVYGEDGAGPENPGADDRSRAGAQLAWLAEQLAALDAPPVTVVALHHPFLQSSAKHRDAARHVWNLTWQGRRLADLLLDGGVALVLAGHTHTCERFRLTRLADGRSLRLLNVSGRPRAGFLWMGAGARRARDWAGREREELAAAGWTGLDGYEIVQEAAMTGDEANQAALITVAADGGLGLEMLWLDEAAPDGLRRDPPVPLD